VFDGNNRIEMLLTQRNGHYQIVDVKLRTPDDGLRQRFLRSPRIRIHVLAGTGHFLGNRLQLKYYKFQILHQLTPVDGWKMLYYFVLDDDDFFFWGF
jgi:hypothetical protein